MAEGDTIDEEMTALEPHQEKTPQANIGEVESTRDDKMVGDASGDEEKPNEVSINGWKQLMGNDLLIKVRLSS